MQNISTHLQDLHTVGSIPHTNGVVLRAGDDELAIGRETHRVDIRSVAFEFVDLDPKMQNISTHLQDLHSVGSIPHTNGVVLRAGDDELAIGRETHRFDSRSVAKTGRILTEQDIFESGIMELNTINSCAVQGHSIEV